MQNQLQNPQQMAQMAAMNAPNGPTDGTTPMMSNMANPKRINTDPREQLNTYIYDYFLRNNHYQAARAMLDSGDMKMSTGSMQKTSPNNRSNGIDSKDQDAGDFPSPQLPPNQMADNSFLLDWWVQFWDIYQATKTRGPGQSKGQQYITHTRNLTQMQNDQRNQRMMMNNPMNAQYQQMMRNGMTNGVGGATNDMKRTAAMNNRPNGNPMGGMQKMNPGMQMAAAQMQRDGSQMDMNGQRPQSPGSNENAPSPNKRPRVDGGMNAGNMPGNQFGEFAPQGQNPQQKNMEVYAQTMAQQTRMAMNNTSSPQGMNNAVQGSPMPHPGLDGQENIFAGNGPRNGLVQASGAPQQGNHALQDYQMQLMLLEQQNKKRLLMARQEQDNMSAPHQGPVGGPGFANAMSPSGSRPGPSPNPADQMKRGTPKLNQPGLPGSPMPEGGMQNRTSPAPMNFDPNLAPPGMPPQFYQQMPQNGMMRPPSSHPNQNFAGQQMTPEQMQAMRGQQLPNGTWRGPPQPGMMPGQQPMGPMGVQNPQQRQQMPPPPAPTNEQPRPEASPAVSNQAPPTPQQGNKANPKKKPTKDTKKPANKKGATGATPATSNGDEPPTPTSSTPAAPITPVHKGAFPPNGQPQQPLQPQAPNQQQQMDAPFGNLGGEEVPSLGFDLNFGDDAGALENFDFDSFLHTGDNDNVLDGFDTFNDFQTSVDMQ